MCKNRTLKNENMNSEEKLDLIFNKLNEDEQNRLLDNQFIYLFTKAELYLKLGAEKYRKDDFFHQPSIDYTENDLELLKIGCIQITEGKGFSEQTPLHDIDVFGFSKLMKLFHFVSESRTTNYQFTNEGKSGALDCITFKHMMDDRTTQMFNFCCFSS